MERTAGGLRVTKSVDVPARGESVAVEYVCSNTGDTLRRGIFVSEWNLSPPHAPGGDDRIALLALGGRTTDMTGGPGAEAGVRTFAVRGSAAYALQCEADAQCGVWHYPVETVSSSEGGLERVAQGVAVSLVRGIDLAPGASWRFGFVWRVVEAQG